MAVTTETQAYLTETKSPTITPTQVKATLKTLLAGIGNYQAELATEIRLLNAALFAETDLTVIAQLELMSQTLGALRREISELENQARDVAQPLDQWVTYDAAFRAVAAPLGYTV